MTDLPFLLGAAMIGFCGGAGCMALAMKGLSDRAKSRLFEVLKEGARKDRRLDEAATSLAAANSTLISKSNEIVRLHGVISRVTARAELADDYIRENEVFTDLGRRRRAAMDKQNAADRAERAAK